GDGAATLAGAGRLAGAVGVAVSALARVGMRLFTFSTTTALVRPWLKLWRTTPCSTPRPFRVRVLLWVTLSFFSPVFSVVSAIPNPIIWACALFHFLLCTSADLPSRRPSDGEPARKRARRAVRARNVLLSGPASRAACTTFGRPNA